MKRGLEAQCLDVRAHRQAWAKDTPGSGPWTSHCPACLASAGLCGSAVANLGSEGGEHCGRVGQVGFMGGRNSPAIHDPRLLSHELPMPILGTFFFLNLPESPISHEGILFSSSPESSLIVRVQ